MFVRAVLVRNHASETEGEVLPSERPVTRPRAARGLPSDDRSKDRREDVVAGKTGRRQTLAVHLNAEREHGSSFTLVRGTITRSVAARKRRRCNGGELASLSIETPTVRRDQLEEFGERLRDWTAGTARLQRRVGGRL